MAKKSAVINFDGDNNTLVLQGPWMVAQISSLERLWKRIALPKISSLTIDAKALETLDTAGAWVLQRVLSELKARNITTNITGLGESQQAMLDLVTKQSDKVKIPEKKKYPGFLYCFGKKGEDKALQFVEFLAFIGELFVEFVSTVPQRKKLQWRSIFSHIEDSGCNALPILALLSFG